MPDLFDISGLLWKGMNGPVGLGLLSAAAVKKGIAGMNAEQKLAVAEKLLAKGNKKMAYLWAIQALNLAKKEKKPLVAKRAQEIIDAHKREVAAKMPPAAAMAMMGFGHDTRGQGVWYGGMSRKIDAALKRGEIPYSEQAEARGIAEQFWRRAMQNVPPPDESQRSFWESVYPGGYGTEGLGLNIDPLHSIIAMGIHETGQKLDRARAAWSMKEFGKSTNLWHQAFANMKTTLLNLQGARQKGKEYPDLLPGIRIQLVRLLTFSREG